MSHALRTHPKSPLSINRVGFVAFYGGMSCNFEQHLINRSSGLELKINVFFPIPLDLGKGPLQGDGKLSTFAMGVDCAVWSPKKEEGIFCHVPLPQSSQAGPLWPTTSSTLCVLCLPLTWPISSHTLLQPRLHFIALTSSSVFWF